MMEAYAWLLLRAQALTTECRSLTSASDCMVYGVWCMVDVLWCMVCAVKMSAAVMQVIRTAKKATDAAGFGRLLQRVNMMEAKVSKRQADLIGVQNVSWTYVCVVLCCVVLRCIALCIGSDQATKPLYSKLRYWVPIGGMVFSSGYDRRMSCPHHVRITHRSRSFDSFPFRTAHGRVLCVVLCCVAVSLSAYFLFKETTDKEFTGNSYPDPISHSLFRSSVC